MTLTLCLKLEHAGMPIIECENVRLAGHGRRRLVDVLMAWCPVAVAAFVIGFWVCVWGAVDWLRS